MNLSGGWRDLSTKDRAWRRAPRHRARRRAVQCLDDTMLTDNKTPSRAARIVALSAVTLALGGALWLFGSASHGTVPRVAVTTSCKGFAADTRKLFDRGDSIALRSTFAAGDHVHLAIDFDGVAGYAWELTGAMASQPEVSGSSSLRRSRRTTTWMAIEPNKPTASDADSASTTTVSTVYRGNISGYAKLALDFDVATAGEGALTIEKMAIEKTSGAASSTRPRVLSASCSPAQG
jgi:hypothetical protein